MLLEHYFASLSDQAMEVWNLFGPGDKARYISVHFLVQNLTKSRASNFLAAHILFGFDVTSKVGTKAANIKQIVSTLSLFGESQQLNLKSLQRSEQYLVKLSEPKTECNTFDNLRYHLHINKRKAISELPSISVSMTRHMLRLYYLVYIHRSLYHPQKSTNLDPTHF